MNSHYDVIVIGSGFGGSVAASTLVNAGQRVLLLERGPWRDTRPVRMAGIDKRSPLPQGRHFYSHLLHRLALPWTKGNGIRMNRHGLFDIHLSADMSVICSSSVGGGSHVYSAMNTRPAKSDYWDGHSQHISSSDMEAHYQWMIATMGARQPTADDNIPNFTGTAFRDSKDFIADDSVGQPAMSVRMEGDPDDWQNNSFLGSQSGSKATLDQRLLLPAIGQGLEIRALHECLAIWRTPNGYRLDVQDHQRKQIINLTSHRVVLAAGTLNTLRLLFHSRDVGGLKGMQALGRGFGGNGDVPAWWPLNSEQNLSSGTPCHGRFALRANDSDQAMTLPGCLPVDLTRYGVNGIEQIPLPARIRQRLQRDLIVVGMGADNANGVARWHKGRLSFRYLQESNPILASVYAHLAEVGRRSGSALRFMRNRPLTVHPLGGARLADHSESGVVNGFGEVHDHPGLFIADAAALPAAPGTPPSMTISAWARHVALHIPNATHKKAVKARSKTS